MHIALDARLTPPQNAQKYYQAYKKACTAEKILTEQIAKGREELTYLDSVLDALSRAETENDLEQLRAELAEQGYLRLLRRKGKPPKSLPPMEFTASDGTRILVGRNNRQNDQLTLKTANKNDIWLHTQNIPGSHVILETGGKRAVPEGTGRGGTAGGISQQGTGFGTGAGGLLCRAVREKACRSQAGHGDLHQSAHIVCEAGAEIAE